LLLPSRSDFRALARQETLIPVRRELLADCDPPAPTFLRVGTRGPAFLMQPAEGIRIMNTVADLGKRKLYILAEVNEEAVNNIQDTLELTTQPAIDSVETTLVVDGKRAINTYLTM